MVKTPHHRAENLGAMKMTIHQYNVYLVRVTL